MLKERRQLFIVLFVIADAIVLAVAWALAYLVRFELPLVPVTKGVPLFRYYLPLLPLIWAVWGLVFRAFGLYGPMRGRPDRVERRLVLRASSLAMLIFTAASFLSFEKAYSLSRLTLVVFYILSTAAIAAERAMLREVLRQARGRGYNLRHVLIVGDGELAKSLADRISWHPELGLKIGGFLTDEPARVGSFIGSAPICGLWDDVADVVSSGNVDQVLMALPFEALPRLAGLVMKLDSAAVDVKVVPDVERFVSIRSGIEEFEGLPVISLRATPLSGWNRMLKRLVDVVVSAFAVVLLSPLLLSIAILVKLTSRGPVLYSQERMSLDGRVFRVWKFRTMTRDAELASGPVWAVRNDPRRTVFGAWLRRLSLDELPQLVNVLRGDMSLVGPRPERPVFIEEFRRHVPRYMLRHMVQAGMTGWAQVHGWRGNTSVEQRIEYDMYYIENWSLLLDFKILLLTFVRGIVNRNAY